MKRYIDTFRGLPRAVWVLAIIVLVNRAGSMVLPFMSLYMTNRLGADAETVGRVLAAYGIGAVTGVALGGWLVDRIDKRLVMIGSLVANGIGFLIMGHIEHIEMLTVAMYLVGAVGEAFRPANAAALATATRPGELQKAYALHQLAVNLGMSIGATLGGALAAISYHALFYVDGGSCLAAALLLPLLVTRAGVALRVRNSDTTKNKLRLGAFGLFLVAYGLVAILFVQFFSTATLYYNENNGFSEGRIGALLAVNTVLISVLQMPIIASVARFTKLRIVAGGALFFASAFALLPWSHWFSVAVVSSVLWTIGELIMLPSVNAYIAESAPTDQVGRWIGAASAAFTVGRMVGPLGGTIVFQRLGGDVLWWGCAVIAGALALGYALAGNASLVAAAPEHAS